MSDRRDQLDVTLDANMQARLRSVVEAHARRLNTLLCGFIAWSVLAGWPDEARTMHHINGMFGDWLERSWRPAQRAVRSV